MSDNTEFTTTGVQDPLEESGTKRACLIMIRGDYIGRVYELEQESTVIGRNDEADLVLSDTEISRKHAVIKHIDDGWFFADLASTNGCWVNYQRVKDSVRLNEGDKIKVGGNVFKFSYQDDDDAEYHERMRSMAVKDGLTGIYNRQYFDETLEKEIEFSRRNATGLAIVLLDIDHFKEVNDKWGHPAGDNLLKQFCQLVENCVRGYDLFARFGGEEFVFLLKGVKREDAITLAERVRELTEKQIFLYEDLGISITVSLGVASWDEGLSDEAANFGADEVLTAADRCLYEAKENGRNRVSYAD